nr:MAG TPA: hypothetical protein [Crassvirales sp.]
MVRFQHTALISLVAKDGQLRTTKLSGVCRYVISQVNFNNIKLRVYEPC